MARTINPIKLKLVEKLEAEKATLGVKTIKRDISPDDIVQACKEELAYFPAILVNYAGRLPTREGPVTGGSMLTDPTYALFVCDRNVSGAFVSGSTCIDLIEDLVELIDGKRFAAEQKAPFEFAGDQLQYQDATLVIYQLLFRTQTVHQRRF